MGKFCSRCGSPTKETDVFCGKCGLDLRGQSVMQVPASAVASPAKPVRRAPSKEKPLRKAANAVMQYVHFILIALLIFTLVLGIMNFAAKHSVSVQAVAKFNGEVQRERQKMELSELYEVEEFALLAISGLVYGVFNFILSGFAGFAVFMRMKSPRGLKRLIKNYSLTGLCGNGLYLILVWIFGVHKQDMGGAVLKAVVSPHFTVWLSIVLFGLLLASAMLSRTRRRRR